MNSSKYPGVPVLHSSTSEEQLSEYCVDPITLGRSSVINENLRVGSVILQDSYEANLVWLEGYTEHLDTTRLNTLGAFAIADGIVEDNVFSETRNKIVARSDMYEQHCEKYAEKVFQDAEATREFFITLKGDQRNTTEAYLKFALRGTIIQEWINDIDPRQDNYLLDVFAYEFTDEQLINFAQWNVRRTARAQEVLNNNIEIYRTCFKEGIKSAVGLGWFPPEAVNNLEQLDRVEFYAGDIFDSSGRNIQGYFCQTSFENSKVIIAAENILDGGIPAETIAHEMMHVIGGKSEDGKKLGMRFSKQHMWLDEAMTEHMIMALLGNNYIEDPYPYVHVDVNQRQPYGAYVGERELLSLVLNYTKFEDLAKAYFSKDKKLITDSVDTIQKAIDTPVYRLNINLYTKTESAYTRRVAMKRLVRWLSFKQKNIISRQTSLYTNR